MAKSSAGRVTTSRCRVKTFPGDGEGLSGDRMKLRAVLLLLSAPRGAKVATARNIVRDFKAQHWRASLRTLYRWRRRYLLAGFAGIARKGRSDRGLPSPRIEAWLQRIAETSIRVRRRGDLWREYRQLCPPFAYRTFRFWALRLAGGLPVIRDRRA
jgi:hypothetical protein